MKQQQAIQVAVVIERTAQPNAWEDWRFRLLEVVPDEGAFGAVVRCLHDDGKTSRWLHPGFTVELFADECKGYFLNLTSGRPAWFVSWLIDPERPAHVQLTAVSLSYIEADRRMTAEEVVEIVPLESELCEWLRVFTNENFRPDTGRKVRAMSFLTPEERERLVTAGDATQQASPRPTTRADVAQPTPGSDAVATSAPGEDVQLRNEALRKLFLSDPHFRQPDELNVRVDEVISVAQSPLARQHKIRQARALGLLDDDLLDQGGDEVDGAGGSLAPPR